VEGGGLKPPSPSVGLVVPTDPKGHHEAAAAAAAADSGPDLAVTADGAFVMADGTLHGGPTLASVNYVQSPVPGASTSWNDVFRNSKMRDQAAEKLEPILAAYTSKPREFAKQLERTAFEAASGDESYYQLLAIQTYKLRKLAQGEIMPPSLPISRAPMVDAQAMAAMDSVPAAPPPVTTQSSLLAPPIQSRFDARLPSLPGIFPAEIDFAEVNLLAWDPQTTHP